MASTTLRLPDGLYDRIRAVAELDRRSVNSELVWLLERGIDCQEGRPEALSRSIRHKNGDPRDNSISNLEVE
jgi:hypothetical protein